VRYQVEMELTGVTTNVDIAGVELSRDFLNGYNGTMKAEGNFPAGIISVSSANIENDITLKNGEDNVFLMIVLLVEANSRDLAIKASSDMSFLCSLADLLVQEALPGEENPLTISSRLDVSDVEMVRERRAQRPFASLGLR